jgi:transposase-like protein
VAGSGRRNADEALALALASGATLRDAAAAVGIAERTATRRWADPAFRRHVSQLRGNMVTRALGRMADGMSEAADVLRQLLAPSIPPAVRLGACRAMLELGCKLRESVELEARLAAVENATEDRDEQKTIAQP